MRISVAMAVYNGAMFLEEQLHSIFNQSLQVDEVIIIDDASSDDSIQIIQSVDNPLINLSIHSQNEGLVRTFEEAIRKCNGDIIFLCDQDDIWYSNKVESFIKTFDETGALVCFSDADILGQDSASFIEELGLNTKLKNTIYQGKMDLVLANKNVISGALSAFKNEVLNMNIFPFIYEEKHMLHDRFLYSIVSTQFPDKVHFINEKLSTYRVHEGQHIGFNTQENVDSEMSRSEYFTYEMKLREYVLERSENQHFRRAHYFWFIRSQLHTYSFLQKFIRINTLYLEGDYKRFTNNPIREALADLKL